MKIRIELTVEVDADAWMLNYGTPASEIREDVRAYVREAIAQAPVPMVSVAP
jgi:hypothetical protein